MNSCAAKAVLLLKEVQNCNVTDLTGRRRANSEERVLALSGVEIERRAAFPSQLKVKL